MSGSYDLTTHTTTSPMPVSHAAPTRLAMPAQTAVPVPPADGARPARSAFPRLRLSGVLCAAGGLIAAVGAAWSIALTSSVPTDELSWPYGPGLFRVTEPIWAVTHVLTFLGALGLARCGLAGRGRAARIGNPLMLVGMALLVPCELAFIPFASSSMDDPGPVLASTLIGIASMIAGVGFVLTGVGVLRERALRGAGRFVPLLCGVFVFVGLTPLVMAGGDVFFLGVGGWNVFLALLGVVVARAGTALETAAQE